MSSDAIPPLPNQRGAPITIRAWSTPVGDLRLQVTPVAEPDVARWQRLLLSLPAVSTAHLESFDGRMAVFTLGGARVSRVLAQLRRVAMVDGDEVGNPATGEVTLRLRAVALPATTPAVAAAVVPADYRPPAPPPQPSIPAATLAEMRRDARAWRQTFQSVVAHLDAQREADRAGRRSLREAFPRLRAVPYPPADDR